MKNLFPKLVDKRVPASNEEILVGKDKGKKHTSRRFTIFAVIAIALMLCTCTFLYMDIITRGTEAASDSYDDARDQKAEEVYDSFYDASYKRAWETYYTKNRVDITIGDLKEQNKLEVLQVSCVDYAITSDEDKGKLSFITDKLTGTHDYWIEIPGSGVFVVNMQEAEFITDNERDYVLVRIPQPELGPFKVDVGGIKPLVTSEGGKAKEGIDVANESIKEGERRMTQEIMNNQDYYTKASESARFILTNLIKQLNPKRENLVVDVEFVD